jgi:hydrogenase/urease accessory protein HupE
MLVCAASTAVSKCTQPIYEVSGSVTDEIGKLAPAAIVGVSWIERGHAQGPVFAVTDETGHYTLRFRFDKYTGNRILFGEVCKGALREIGLAAYGAGNHSEEMHVPVSEEKILAPTLVLGYRSL